MGRVVVLGGGDSSERDISLLSSRSVYEALVAKGYDVILIDPAESDEYFNLDKNEIVFPILHGKFGEDGELQKMLEDKNIAFLGSGSLSSQQSFDKGKTVRILRTNNIPVPRGQVIAPQDYLDHPLAQKPHVAKLIKGGSSIGTLIQRDSSPIDQATITKEFGNQEILIEELINGPEVTIPILDGKALPVIEIQPPSDGEFDYENKYNGKTKEFCPPVAISEPIQDSLKELAEKVHEVMGCRHLSRVDIMLDEKSNPYVLEINTMPGMTNESLFPKSAEVAGMSMQELVARFVDLVKRDYSLD